MVKMGASGVRSMTMGNTDGFGEVVKRRFNLGMGRGRGLGVCGVVDGVWFR